MSSVNPVAVAAIGVKQATAQTKQEREPASDAQVQAAAKAKLELTLAQREKHAKLTAAAEQFEAIFVRQLLKSAHFGGSAGQSGHGQMAIDALANSVVKGGGLGFADQLRDDLFRSYLQRPSDDA